MLDPFPRRGADGADRRGTRRHPQRPRAVRARLSAVPRAPAVRGDRRRPRDTPGSPTARRAAPALDRGRARPRRATCRSSSCSRYADARGPTHGGRDQRPAVRRQAGLEPAARRPARTTTLRVNVRIGRAPARGRRAPGGDLAELRIPGVTAREHLRPPSLIEDARSAAPTSRRSPLTYLFSAHERRRPVPPRRADRAAAGAAGARSRGRRDPDRAPDRAAGRARVPGRRLGGTVSPTAADPALDAMAGSGRRVRLLGALRGAPRGARRAPSTATARRRGSRRGGATAAPG